MKKSAEQGYVDAEYHLASLYATGKGTAIDDVQAFYWFKKASEHGHINAQASLAFMYGRGLGTAQDFKLAYYWSNSACQKGETFACRYVKELNILQVPKHQIVR